MVVQNRHAEIARETRLLTRKLVEGTMTVQEYAQLQLIQKERVALLSIGSLATSSGRLRSGCLRA